MCIRNRSILRAHMYTKNAAGLVKSYSPKKFCTLNKDYRENLTMQHYKQAISNKYMNSFKSVALSTWYKRCVTKSDPKILFHFKLNYALLIFKIKCNLNFGGF